jgi:hypothetical protein
LARKRSPPATFCCVTSDGDQAKTRRRAAPGRW